MNQCTLPFLALSLLLGACSSFTPIQTSHATPPPPIPTDTKVTVWGELPSYNPSGHHFRNLRAPNVGAPGLTGAVTIDLLVNHDGSIEDIAVFESSGDSVLDHAAISQFRKARYTLQLDPTDPSPYVVRQTVVMKSDPYVSAPSGHSRGVDPSQHKNLGGPTGPTQGYSTAGP